MRFILTLAFVSLLGLSGCQTPTYRVQVFQAGKKVAEFVHEGYLSHWAGGGFREGDWAGLDLRVIEGGGKRIEATILASDGVIIAERIDTQE